MRRRRIGGDEIYSQIRDICAKSTGKKSPAPGRTGPSWARATAWSTRWCWCKARNNACRQSRSPPITRVTPIVLISPQAKPVTNPRQLLDGIKLGSKKGSATFQGLVALLAANNMQLEQIKLVDIGFGVQPLLVKQVDAIMGFSMNEPIEAESGGMAVSLMPISDYGVNTYGLTIVSNPDFMQQKPEGDRAYGAAFTYRLRAIGIRDKPIAPGSPWQNGFAERLIGSIRRECVDHIVVLGD